MKYEIYSDEKHNKRVKFEDGTDYAVDVDVMGKEYFPVPNIYIEDKTFKLFTGRIKDAVTAIREGHGDVLILKTFFSGRTENVYRYVDREYGEEMRSKSLEGWKGTEFAYAINFRKVEYFDDGRLLTDKDTLTSPFFYEPYKQFNTYDEAKIKQESIIAKADSIMGKVEKKAEDTKAMYKVVKSLPMDSVLAGIIYAEMSGSKWSLEIVQTIKEK